VEQVIGLGIEPASHFPLGPYPKDRITHIKENEVQFETPANAVGIGTEGGLNGFAKTSDPINGVAIIMSDRVVLLAVRTPNVLLNLVPLILENTRQTGAAR
jgi:hypothetical protein